MTYTRQPAHWAQDTKGRFAFEGKVRKALRDDGEFELLDATDSFDEVDFELGCRGRRIFLEVKEKRQSYREAWSDAAGIDEPTLFILDELSARKIVLRAPRAYLLLNDSIRSKMFVLGALELITIPKMRVDRSIDGGIATFKGKWLIDMHHGEEVQNLGDACELIKRRCSSEDEMWRALACHGRYDREKLPRF